ncbi:hypothetical protein C8R46DRAFT_1064857 [Mycena filopes]|nr:hypothetical protein C8R46DRAFT_1064857 [Mycena filopes]
MDLVKQHPVFPPELERLICETAALLHPRSMLALILVAQRMKIWIEPLLYQVLAVHSGPSSAGLVSPRHTQNSIANLLEGRRQSFFQKHVRHVCFMDFQSEEFIASVLGACTGTVNLAFRDLMGGPALLPILDALPLQRLAICLDRLFLSIPGGMDFSRPLFAHITHLDILDWRDEGREPWAGLARIPHLTHLSFSYHDYLPIYTCRDVLRACKRLRVLAALCTEALLPKFTVGLTYSDLDADPRFVLVIVPDDLVDWEVGARGGGDYWDVADEMVKQRRLTMAVADEIVTAN